MPGNSPNCPLRLRSRLSGRNQLALSQDQTDQVFHLRFSGDGIQAREFQTLPIVNARMPDDSLPLVKEPLADGKVDLISVKLGLRQVSKNDGTELRIAQEFQFRCAAYDCSGVVR